MGRCPERHEGSCSSRRPGASGPDQPIQFRDIRPKAVSEITNVDHVSLLLGHIKGDIAERVSPSWSPGETQQIGKVSEALPIPKGVPMGSFTMPQKRKKP